MNPAPPASVTGGESPSGLRRALSARHLTMIAVGGSIGTGLFVASGATVARPAPGALLGYALIGIMVYFLMTSLGELAAAMPVSGSFSTYGARYVEEGFGFALGWNYWYNWAVTVAVDLVAAQLVMAYWFPDIPGVYWSALFLAITFGLNALSARGFGEAEFWFALIKVVAVLAFVVMGVMMLLGIIRGGDRRPGQLDRGRRAVRGRFRGADRRGHGGGLFLPGHRTHRHRGRRIKDPARNLPRAVRQVFWRILLFYVMAILVIGLLIPYTDPQLLRPKSPTSASAPSR